MAPRPRKQRSGNLAWIDLEMTGLDETQDVIIQAALVVTDSSLKPLEEFVCDVWQPEDKLQGMNPYVREMHTRTGLLERLKQARLDLRVTEHLLLERVSGWCPFPAILCGNSVGQDKRFIDRHMPGLAKYLSYRLVDVTSLKILARLWHGDEAVYEKPDTGQHDALVDIKNSIAELAPLPRHAAEVGLPAEDSLGLLGCGLCTRSTFSSHQHPRTREGTMVSSIGKLLGSSRVGRLSLPRNPKRSRSNARSPFRGQPPIALPPAGAEHG